MALSSGSLQVEGAGHRDSQMLPPTLAAETLHSYMWNMRNRMSEKGFSCIHIVPSQASINILIELLKKHLQKVFQIHMEESACIHTDTPLPYTTTAHILYEHSHRYKLCGATPSNHKHVITDAVSQ